MLPPERIASAGPLRLTLPASRAATDGRAGAFDDELRPLEEEDDRLADLLIGDGDDVVEEVLERTDVSSPGCLTAMPSAIV